MLLSHQLGKPEKILEWFKKWVEEYKPILRDHVQAVNKLLDKMLEYPEVPALVTLAFQNITDKLNRTKLLLTKAKSMLKRDDPSLTQNIVQTLDEAHSYLKNQDGNDDSMQSFH